MSSYALAQSVQSCTISKTNSGDANKVETDISYTVAVVVTGASAASGTIRGLELNLANWRSTYELQLFVTPACTSWSNASTSSTCSIDSSGSNFLIRVTNVAYTSRSFSFRITVKQGPYKHSAAVTTAKCAFYSAAWGSKINEVNAASFTPAVLEHDTQSLTATTISTVATKQCTADATKTRNGETDVILKTTYTLGIRLELNKSQIKLSVPMRYFAYVDGGSVLGSTVRQSMLPSSLTNVYVKVVHGSNEYYASKILTTIQSDNTNDILTADFTNEGVLIAAGQTIEVHVTGITNPPTNAPLPKFYIEILGRYSLTATTTYYRRENTASVMSTGLTTCAYESEEASANAIIGYDRVGTKPAHYRFRFRTKNVHPTASGFQITMPVGYTFTASTDYRLTCLGGCTTALTRLVATTTSSNVITWDDCFNNLIAAGTLVDLFIEGWQNAATETIYSPSFTTVWSAANDYHIDKFQNLGDLSSSDAVLSSAWASTRIIVTDANRRSAVDCRIRPPQRAMAALNVNTAGAQDVETVSQKFVAVGAACGARSAFKLKAYAKFDDGTLLHPRYAKASISGGDIIQVTLTPTADSNSATKPHAVYVQVTDGTNSQAINTFCFMIVLNNAASNLPNYCQTYCQQQEMTQASSSLLNELDYFVKSSAPTTITYTTQFSQVSSNTLMCPVVYEGQTRVSATHVQGTQAVSSFNPTTGGFVVRSSTAAMVLANGQGSEIYSFLSATESFSKTTPFTIYFQGCQDAFLVPLQNHSINAVLASVSNTLSYTNGALGFESSDPTNCPIGATGVNPTGFTFCDYPACSSTSLANMWATNGNSLDVTRTLATSLSTEVKIKVTATFGSTSISVENVITLSILPLSSGTLPSTCLTSDWNCYYDCNKDDIVFNANVTAAAQTIIKANTYGCAACPVEHFMEYTTVQGSYVRKCTKIPETRRLSEATHEDERRHLVALIALNEPCGLGLLYDSTLQCTKPCSEEMPSCALCSSATQCLMCDSTSKTAIDVFDAAGKTKSVCVPLEEVCHDCQTTCTVTNCNICDKGDSSICQVCKKGYFLRWDNTCVQVTTNELSLTYYVSAVTANKIKYTTAELAAINGNKGLQTTEKLQFLQQVFNRVNSDIDLNSIETKKKVTVNVVLDFGEHFLFSCHEDLYASYTADLSSGDFTDLCASIPTLKPVMPLTDNIEWVIKPSSGTATIHVLDSYYNFNVTKSMTFEDVTFTGQHALAAASTTGTPTHPPLATLAIKKCDLTSVRRCDSLPDYTCLTSNEPTNSTWGSHKALEFTLSSVSALSGKYTCTDSGFSAPTVPMKSDEPCSHSAESSTIQSVRGCPGEPYNSDFFDYDSASKIPYKRHRTLFNLYNFDRQRSSDPTQYASLTLKNCKFEYFLADYTSLINVETNNMVVVPSTGAGVKDYVIELGENKGVNLNIALSTFSNSRFCKGMIAHKKRYQLETTSALAISSLNNLQPDDPVVPVTDTSLIEISDSTFENLSYGRVIKTLSLDNHRLYPITGLTTAKYPAFDNHGMAVNLQGFPGGVDIANSTFTKNMAFIPDIYPSKLKPKAEIESLGSYNNSLTGQVHTTRCNSENKIKRFFSDFLNALEEQPSQELAQLEKYAAIYISLNRQPVYIIDNKFTNNTGTLGGSIAIDTPNFVDDYHNETSLAQRPYVVVKTNEFEKSQAYVAGNAIYFRGTRQRASTNETTEVCGAGINIVENTFTENSPIIHASNGGAIALECDFVTIEDSKIAGGASNTNSTEAFQTIWTSEYSNDAYGYMRVHKVYRYAAAILGNTFTQNAAGQKGTAVYARQISNLIIKDNTFTYNRPAMALYTESKEQPYQNLLLQKTNARPVLYHNEDPKLNLNIDEWEYMRVYSTMYSAGGIIPASQHQGTIYTETCQTCLVNHEYGADQQTGCTFCFNLTQEMVVEGNTFKDNDDGLSFYKEENLPRAGLLMARGGHKYSLNNNKISYVASSYFGSSILVLENYYNWLPRTYWEGLRAPLFRLDVPDGKAVSFNGNSVAKISWVEPLFDDLAYNGTLVQFDNAPGELNFTAQENVVDDVVSYGGDTALFHIDGAALNATDNKFTRIGRLDDTYHDFRIYKNYVLKGRYFALDKDLWASRTWTQTKGVFRLRGAARNESKTVEPQLHAVKNNYFDFMFCHSGCVLSQELPDFGLPVYMEFENNTFTNIFGHEAAVVDTLVTYPQSDAYTYAVYNFTDEFFANITNGAVSMKGHKNDVVLLMQRIEVIESIGSPSSSIIDLSQGHLFLCKECKLSGRRLLDPPQWADYYNEFMWRYKEFTLLNRTTFIDYLPLEQSNESFGGSSHQKGVVSLDNVVASHGSITPDTEIKDLAINGTKLGFRLADEYQFIFKRDWSAPEKWKVETWVYWHARDWQYNVYEEWLKGNPDFLPFSLITNSTFDGNHGTGSVMSIQDAEIEIRTSNFDNNKMLGPYGTTVNTIGTKLIVREHVSFANNEAMLGGALRMSRQSSLLAHGVQFVANLAHQQGGALMFQEAQDVTLYQSVFNHNKAGEIASVLWASNGLDITSIVAEESTFSNNEAKQAMAKLDSVSMKMVNCILLNNTATEVTNGFALAQTHLKLDNTLVRNFPQRLSRRLQDDEEEADTTTEEADDSEDSESDEDPSDEESEDEKEPTEDEESTEKAPEPAPQYVYDETVSAGFFYLTSQSEMEMKHSQVQGTNGRVASVVYLTTGSQLTMSNIRLDNLAAPADCKFDNSGVIVGQLASAIRVHDSHFSDNDCSYIYSDRTPVEIKETTFTNGKRKPYINMVGSALLIENSTIEKAKDDQFSVGRGVKCFGCTQISIMGSTFQDLFAQQGGAIYIENSDQGQIYDSTFQRNEAYQGGAAYIANSFVISTANQFQDNTAESLTLLAEEKLNVQQYAQRTGRGGAIYLTCLETDSDLAEVVFLTNKTTSEESEEGEERIIKPECDISSYSTNGNVFNNNTADSTEGPNIYYAWYNDSVVVTREEICQYHSIGEDCVQHPADEIKLSLSSEQAIVEKNGELGPIYTYLIDDYKSFPGADELTRGALNFTSGYNIFNLTLTSYDRDGQLLKDDDTLATMQFRDGFPPNSTLSGATAVSNQGVFVFERVQIIFKPDSTQIIDVNIQLAEPYAQFVPFLNGEARYNILLYARPCAVGEEYTQDYRCQNCQDFTYSFTALTEPGECPPCPQYGVCQDGALYPEPGYVRMTKDSEVFVRCTNEESCLQGNKKDPLKNCDSAYQGVMCGQCADHHWRVVGTFKCYECFNTAWSTIKFYLSPIAYLLCVMWLSLVFIDRIKQQNQQWTASARMIINFNQITQIFLMQADSLSLKSPNSFLKTFMDYLVSVQLPMYWLLDFQCAEHITGFTPAQSFYMTLWLYILLPIILTGLNFLIWSIYMQVQAFRKDLAGNRYICKRLVNRAATTTGVSLFLIWPQLTGFLLQSTSCFRSLSDEDATKDDPVYRLKIVPDVICYDNQYNISLVGITIALIFYAIVVPALAWRAMSKHATQMYISATTSYNDLQITQQMELLDVKSFYGFFFSGMNLGSETFKIQTEVDPNAAGPKRPGEGEEKSLGSKCKAFFSSALDPLNGGMKVMLPKKAGDDLADEQEYTRSYYHWEFVIHLQKLVMQLLVVYMYDMKQALQGIVMLIVCLIFLAINVINRKVYFKPHLNNLNLNIQLMFFVWIFTRMMVRTNTLDGEPLYEGKLESSQTGLPLPDEYIDISRSKKIDTGNNDGIMYLMMIPVMLQMLQIELTFLFQGLIYVLTSWVENNQFSKFKFLTCNLWKVEDFRARYIEDTTFLRQDDATTTALNLKLGVTAVESQHSESESDGRRPPAAIHKDLLDEPSNKVVDPKDIKIKQKKPEEMSEMATMLGLTNPREKNRRPRMRIDSQPQELNVDQIVGAYQDSDKKKDKKDKKEKKDKKKNSSSSANSFSAQEESNDAQNNKLLDTNAAGSSSQLSSSDQGPGGHAIVAPVNDKTNVVKSQHMLLLPEDESYGDGGAMKNMRPGPDNMRQQPRVDDSISAGVSESRIDFNSRQQNGASPPKIVEEEPNWKKVQRQVQQDQQSKRQKSNISPDKSPVKRLDADQDNQTERSLSRTKTRTQKMHDRAKAFQLAQERKTPTAVEKELANTNKPTRNMRRLMLEELENEQDESAGSIPEVSERPKTGKSRRNQRPQGKSRDQPSESRSPMESPSRGAGKEKLSAQRSRRNNIFAKNKRPASGHRDESGEGDRKPAREEPRREKLAKEKQSEAKSREKKSGSKRSGRNIFAGNKRPPSGERSGSRGPPSGSNKTGIIGMFAQD